MTMRAIILTAAVIMSLFGVSVASAQVCDPTGGTAASTLPWYYDGGYSYHASTYEEGVLRGSAAVITSLGQYNLDTSKAAINIEEAKSRYLDNALKYTETYFATRRVNREQREMEMGPRATAQELAAFAKDGAPKRLDGTQYEPALGRVFWPALLQDDAFAPERSAIDAAMASREPANSGLGSETAREVKLGVTRMLEILKANVDKIPPTEYVQAKKFLTSLEWEAQHRMAPTGLALVR
jgi:hypothetical protein